MRMATKLRSDMKGNRFLEPLIKRDHRTVFALDQISDHHRRFGYVAASVASTVELYEACVLVVQFVDIIHRLDSKKAKALTGRLRGALRNHRDMRALQFELQVATHLAKRDFDIEFPETDGTSAYDVLASRESTTLEIECKFVSRDKGRMVHRREALEIHHLMARELQTIADGLEAGIILRIVFSSRPPTAYNDRVELVRRAKRVLLGGDAHMCADYEIYALGFEMSQSPFATSSEDVEEIAEFLAGLGIVNRETISFGRRGVGVAVVSLESARPDRFLPEVFDTVSDASKRQLTGTYAGVVCVKFDDLTADQMVEIGTENGTPTALRIASSEFLASSAARQLAILAFFADGELENADGVITRSGRTYQFVNSANSFAHEFEVTSLFK